jgi:hypothetical protein
VSVAIGLPNVSIGINVPVYPEMEPVPGYPVYYAPGMSSNYFFYDGMYWVYQGDLWYASSWYNGPWGLVAAEDVPVFVLRIPVGYYRQPPQYFIGWQLDASPRWGEHWGPEWEHRRSGWDQWNRNSTPAAAPLPAYQRQYSGARYPRAEQQRVLQGQSDHYQPRDSQVRQQVQAERTRSAATADQRGAQAGSQEVRQQVQGERARNAPTPDQRGAQTGSQEVRQQVQGERARNAPTPDQRGASAGTQARSQVVNPKPQGDVPADSQPAVHPAPPVAQRPQAPQQRAESRQAPVATQAPPQGQPAQRPQQAVAQHQDPAPAPHGENAGPQAKEPQRDEPRGPGPGQQQGAERGQSRGPGPSQQQGAEKSGDRGQEPH